MAAGEGFGAQWEDDIELLKEAHRQIGSRIPAMHLPQLAGLPESWRLCGTGNRGSVKDCFETSWNSDPAKRYTALQLLTKNGSFVQQCIGAGVQTGPASGGLLVLDFDEPDDMALDGLAEGTFQTVFGRPSSELPTTATNSSGRRGRRKVFLMVPEDWWPVLGNWSFDAGPYADNKKHAFEAIWLNGTGSARQAVIAGDHPLGTDTSPLYYHWVDGLHPAVVGVAVAPPWVIGGFIRQVQRGLAPAATEEDSFAAKRAAGDPQPCDLLLPKDQRRLLLMMQKHWPYRGAPAGSPQAASYATQFRPLVAGLLNVLGKDTLLDWLGGQEWDRRNDWKDGNLGSLEELLASLARSRTDDDKKCGWGSVVRAAKDGGFEFPKWALPPKEIDASTLTTGVAKKLEELAKALTVIEGMESPLERECAYQNLAKSLDCTEKELRMLLRHTQEAANPATGGDWNAVVKRAKPIEVAVERLLAFNALTIVASDGGVGKSVLIYRLAEAAANGGMFAGHLQAVKGKVLIVQKDESDSNLAAKDALMQAQMPEGMVRVEFSFNGGMLPELRKWIQEHQARYVFMDSLFSLFGTDGDLSESTIGTYMYLLNAMAAQENCAIVLTHHLRKADKSKSGKRSEIHNQDLYGSSFIVNGTSDVWGVIRDPEASSPTFVLKVLKPRSGITSGGDTYRLSGSLEDLSFQLETVNNVQSKDAIEGLRKSEQKVLAALRERKSAEVGLSKQDLVANTGVSPSGVEKALTRLLADSRMGVQRARAEGAGGLTGRPGYVYWAG